MSLPPHPGDKDSIANSVVGEELFKEGAQEAARNGANVKLPSTNPPKPKPSPESVGDMENSELRYIDEDKSNAEVDIHSKIEEIPEADHSLLIETKQLKPESDNVNSNMLHVVEHG